MKIKKLVEYELEFYRQQCNFVGDEKDVFELRGKGIPLEEIAELKGYTYDGIKKVSKEVSDKIIKVQQHFGTF